ncbi:hypothetical protein [Pseudomonas denitrificans (nom. rej.)]|uniref:Uncharacterized protein n=1 Tax=Pseudomonas denitrificans TaxID=43306 RepID=A0A9X7N4U7_PSEDE|nr:hypothetical protein [Pseudomonas denitrificans (nom. rej.)]QEY75118.1 hypothetical protein F1C79_27770 [Pseudomonas denitrificans (nom. rej.)]
MSKGPQKFTIDVVQTHDNTSQEVITITRDKLKLVVIEHIGRMENSSSWQMPLSLLVTIVLVLCTADFRAFISLDPPFWKAVFYIGAVLSLIWLAVCLWRVNKAPTIDELINAAANKTEL